MSEMLTLFSTPPNVSLTTTPPWLPTQTITAGPCHFPNNFLSTPFLAPWSYTHTKSPILNLSRFPLSTAVALEGPCALEELGPGTLEGQRSLALEEHCGMALEEPDDVPDGLDEPRHHPPRFAALPPYMPRARHPPADLAAQSC